MNEEWVKTTLGDVLLFEYGKALPERSRDGQGYPVLGSAGVVGFHSEPLIDGPGIVVGRKGTAGSVTWVDEAFFPIDTAYWVTIKHDSVLLKFAHLLLIQSDLPSVCAQTGVPGLNRDRAYSLKVSLPPLPVQRRIVDLMTHLDAHIANLQAEQRALSLVASNYRDSTLSRWLQGGCQEESLASVALRAPDYGLGLAATEEAIGPKYLRTTDVISGHIDWSAVQYCDASDSERQKATLHDGDVVVARTGANAGAGALIKDPPDGAVFAGYLVRFRPDATRVNSVFVSEVLQSSLWADYVARTRTGSAQPQFNAKLMGAFPLPLPPIAEQRAFADVLTSIEEGKYSLQSEEQALGAARRKVLSLLLAGHVQPDASYDSLIAEAS